MAGGFFSISATWEAQGAALDVGYLVLGAFYFLIIYLIDFIFNFALQ